jgi:hypothetical protein
VILLRLLSLSLSLSLSQGVRTDGGPIPMKVVVDNSSHVEVSAGLI